jgi:hypothetical protein
MFGINFLAVVAATVAAFLFSSVWYVVFGKKRMELLGNDPGATADTRRVSAWKILGELVRSFVVASVLARLVVLSGVVDWMGAVALGVLVWVGFPAMILVGSVTWDRRPWKLAAIHAGDWLFKLVLMAVILGVWRSS